MMRMFTPTGVGLVTHTSGSAAVAIRHALDMNKEVAAPIIGVIENMVAFGCDNCRSIRPLFPQGEAARIVREADLPIVARLPFDPRFAESSDRGRIFVSEFSDTPLGKQLTEMARQVDAMLVARRYAKPRRALSLKRLRPRAFRAKVSRARPRNQSSASSSAE